MIGFVEEDYPGAENKLAKRCGEIMTSRNKRPVVAISGPSGSGKTTYAKMLARDLGLDYYSAGIVFRELARRKGLSLVELNKLASQDPSIDISIDKGVYERALRGGVVVEGHLVAWIVRDVADVAIYVTADIGERLRRIAERESRDIREVLRETLLREELQWRRFRSYYGIDISSLHGFDLVIDTTHLTIEEAYHVILQYTCSILRRKYPSEALSDKCLLGSR